jgi:hypothetical protein
MSAGRWQPDEVALIAAEYRARGRRYTRVKVDPREMAKLCDKIAEVMRDANEAADRCDELQAKLDAKDAPKYAPFAPKRRA